MPGRWYEDRDRDTEDWRSEADWRDRDGEYGDQEYLRGREERSFGGARQVRSGPDYERSGKPDWQRRDYGGVSPAMQQGEYDAERRAQAYREWPERGGGRYYGDDGRSRLYGRDQRVHDEGQRFGTRDADDRWSREMRRPASGGTGGYDYERGYGDGGYGYAPREDRYRTAYGRGDYRSRQDYEDRGDRFEERARDAGDFFRRTGQKISNWFSSEGRDDSRHEAERGARGLGPKGYKRSDDRISEEAHQHLTDDAWVDASDINISVSGGEVTLSGTVASREAKHRAERIVEELSGVAHVQNNLRVSSPNYFTSAGRGYGDSASESRMRQDPVKAATDGTAQTPQAIQQAGHTDDAASRSTRRS
jgi:osmotically-inducible protein OsmY